MSAIPTLMTCLNAHNFASLFIDELGWDRANGAIDLEAGGREWAGRIIAQKRALNICWCRTVRGDLIDRRLLQRMQDELAGSFHEHILIVTCDEPRKQVWLWSVRGIDGRTQRFLAHPFFSASPPPAFVGRLARMGFSLAEEESIGLFDALDRVRRTLDTRAELELFARKPSYARTSDRLAIAMRKGGPEEFRKFVGFHRGLAKKFAFCLCRWFGMSIEDVEQIGVLGLIEAAKRFEPERGIQFSTYASWWIRQSCQRHGPYEALTIYLPQNLFWPCFRHAIALSHTRAR